MSERIDLGLVGPILNAIARVVSSHVVFLAHGWVSGGLRPRADGGAGVMVAPVSHRCATLCNLVVAQPAAGDCESPAAPFMIRLWTKWGKHPRFSGRIRQSESACRDFPPCCAANLPLSADADGGLYSGHGFSSFPHGTAYRGAVLARLSGPRSPLLALRLASADRSCGVSA